MKYLVTLYDLWKEQIVLHKCVLKMKVDSGQSYFTAFYSFSDSLVDLEGLRLHFKNGSLKIVESVIFHDAFATSASLWRLFLNGNYRATIIIVYILSLKCIYS